MSCNLRHILMIVQAVLVMAMCVQSALDTSHHYAPSAFAAEAIAPVDAEGGEGAATPHEHEAAVDHAMIRPDVSAQRPALKVEASPAPTSFDAHASHRVTLLDRPPRRAA